MADIFSNIGKAIAAPFAGFNAAIYGTTPEQLQQSNNLDVALKQLKIAFMAGDYQTANRIKDEVLNSSPELQQLVQSQQGSIPQQTAAPQAGGGMTIPQGMGGGNAYNVAGAGAQRPQPQQGGALAGLYGPNMTMQAGPNGIETIPMSQSQVQGNILTRATLPQQLQAAGAFPSTYAGQDVMSDFAGGPMGPLQTQRLGREQQTTQADIEQKKASSQSSLASAASSKASASKTLQDIANSPEELKIKQALAEKTIGTTSSDEMAADIVRKMYPNDPAAQMDALTKFRKASATNVSVDAKPPPSELINKDYQLRNLKSLTERAIKNFDPEYTGWLDSSAVKRWTETYLGLGTSEQKSKFRMAIDQLYQEIYALSGAAFGKEEAASMEAYQPKSNQDDETFLNNMKAFTEDLNMRIGNLGATIGDYGYMTPSVVSEKRAQQTKTQTPSTPPTPPVASPEAIRAEIQRRNAANAQKPK